MSLALERILMQDENGLDALLAGDLAEFGVARVTVGQMREQKFGLQIVPEVGQPWHLVAFPLASISKAKSAQTPLAENCELVRVPQRPAVG
jgi:hypothetical protein